MAAPKKNKFSPGRPKGSVNRRSQAFLEVLEAKNFNVAEALLEVYSSAIKEYKTGDDKDRMIGLKIAGDMAKEIAGYVMPKLKAIEHSTKSPLAGMTDQEKLEAARQVVKQLENNIKEAKQIPISSEVEQSTVNAEVGGSTPSSGAND